MGDQKCILSVVYGFYTIERRKQLWESLTKIGRKISAPWPIGGDFNSVLQLQDRMRGNTISMAEIQDFNKCVQDLRLSELAWEGEYYTWSNKQDGSDRIWSRIDRMFGNYEWMMQWGHAATTYDVPFISDQAPMNLCLTFSQGNRKTPFKFFNVWAEHESFLSSVQQIWQQRIHSKNMQNIWLKLKTLRPMLRKLNVEEFKFIRKKIEKARIDLDRVQRSITTNFSDELLLEEK
ncbi:uncharacterized protein [Nicotiana sylvestris]|uniref:uncharacterized protein n=1 Tax=Nicotiana sylvestris TaxID=4096 RepID=UPI00388C4AA8